MTGTINSSRLNMIQRATDENGNTQKKGDRRCFRLLLMVLCKFFLVFRPLLAAVESFFTARNKLLPKLEFSLLIIFLFSVVSFQVSATEIDCVYSWGSRKLCNHKRNYYHHGETPQLMAPLRSGRESLIRRLVPNLPVVVCRQHHLCMYGNMF